MKLRVVPIMWSVVISVIVLFGGWVSIHRYAIEQPFKQSVSEINGIASAHIDFERDQTWVELNLSQEAPLQEVVQMVRHVASSKRGVAPVVVEARSQSSQAIDEWWSQVLFEIAQAMETKQYRDIPLILQQNKSSLTGLHVVTAIDEEWVYIELHQGLDHKYIMLPRIPSQLGVWRNE